MKVDLGSTARHLVCKIRAFGLIISYLWMSMKQHRDPLNVEPSYFRLSVEEKASQLHCKLSQQNFDGSRSQKNTILENNLDSVSDDLQQNRKGCNLHFLTAHCLVCHFAPSLCGFISLQWPRSLILWNLTPHFCFDHLSEGRGRMWGWDCVSVLPSWIPSKKASFTKRWGFCFCPGKWYDGVQLVLFRFLKFLGCQFQNWEVDMVGQWMSVDFADQPKSHTTRAVRQKHSCVTKLHWKTTVKKLKRPVVPLSHSLKSRNTDEFLVLAGW